MKELWILRTERKKVLRRDYIGNQKSSMKKPLESIQAALEGILLVLLLGGAA